MMLRFITARICKSGTVVVQKKGDDFDSGEELGDVLLVKGIGSQVGGGIPPSQLPLLARTTFLPLYDMLVYDGLMIMNSRFPMTAVLKEKIKAHVEKAIREESVIYCGESARRGLWDEAPPALDGGSKKGKDEDDDDKEDEESVAYEPTTSQLILAEKIVEFAKSHGYEGRSNLTAFQSAATLVARKVGFSNADNPNKIVGLNWVYEDSHRGYDMDMFLFRDWPGYTLDELLPELVKKLYKMDEMPGLIMTCERSIVKPLKDTLKAAAEEMGFNKEFYVEWYPPPSAEEEAYHSMQRW